MELYCGIDLHSTNSYVVVLDRDDRVAFQRRLANDLEVVIAALARFGSDIAGVVVESTYNWYWLVDGLEEAGYRVHLANTWAIKQYDGLKYGDDRTDAAWLARTLRLGLLPEGYIYPKEQRPIRDLMRRRTRLVQQNTANVLSIQNMLARQLGRSLDANRIKRLGAADLEDLLGAGAVALACAANLAVMRTLAEQITAIEKAVLAEARAVPEFGSLLSVPGIGRILGLTILLETGDVGRFAGPGNFASYCRCVDASPDFSNPLMHRGGESRKMAIRQSLTAIPERPRCKQSVAQHCSNLNRLNGTRLWPGSMAESSHRMPEGCCWGGWIAASG